MYQGQLNPNGLVTIVNGNGGTKEHHDRWIDPQPDWSAFRETTFGFGTAVLYNNTHLHWQMHRAADGTIRDDCWFIKN